MEINTTNVLLDVSFSRTTVIPNTITPNTLVFKEYQAILNSEEALHTKAKEINNLILKFFPATSHIIFDACDMSSDLYLVVNHLLLNDYGQFSSNLI